MTRERSGSAIIEKSLEVLSISDRRESASIVPNSDYINKEPVEISIGAIDLEKNCHILYTFLVRISIYPDSLFGYFYMNIHVLVPRLPKESTDSAVASNIQLLQDAATHRGHTLSVIATEDCTFTFGKKPSILVNNKKPRFKLMLTQPGFLTKNVEVHASLIRQFELSGIRCVNSFQSIVKAKNKIRMTQKLSKHGIPMPKTYIVHSSMHLSEIMSSIGSFPVILKSVVGSLGIGVAIVESKQGLKSVVEMMLADDHSTPLMIQGYVRESRGKDIRVFVVGGKIVAAMERIARKRDEFRSNFSLGGKVKVASLSAKEKRLALKAAEALGLEIAGVDIIRSNAGPQILEVNSNPGMKGITQATGIDVAGAVIDYIVKRAKRIK